MAINKENTEKLKVRFKEQFEEPYKIYDEDENGCRRIVVFTNDSISLGELNRLVDGVGNTMTIQGAGYETLRIAVW